MKKDRRTRTTYRIEAAPEVEDHLSQFTRRVQATIYDALPGQLGFEPTLETRNRKRLSANPIAPWELRIGDYRVDYEVTEEPVRLVRIVAVGRKIREKVMIGGVEVNLR